MKPVIIIAIAFVLLIPITVFAQEEFDGSSGGELDDAEEVKQTNESFNPIWLLAIGSIATAVITGLYFRSHLRLQKRENERQALLERFNELNSIESKRARKVLVDATYTKDGDYNGDQDLYPMFRRELGVLDTTANLVKNGDVPKERFLDLLSQVIIFTYEQVEPYIKFKQEIRGEHYASDFVWLYGEASKWWKENRPNDPWPKLDDYGYDKVK